MTDLSARAVGIAEAFLEPPLLEIDLERKAFGDRVVLGSLRLSLRAGEIVSLVGASGCGKSTLLRIVAGLDRDYEGRVQLRGQTLSGITRSVGLIFQEPRLFPWLSVAENVGFGSNAGPLDFRAEDLLHEVGLADRASALPKELSGGQAQRVAIARGLYTQPQLLLLDEPFSAVDAFTRMKLQDLLLDVAREHGITVLLVTHDVDEAAYLSDRVAIIGESPGSIFAEVAVGMRRPRDRRDPRLAQRKAEVLGALREAHAI